VLCIVQCIASSLFLSWLQFVCLVALLAAQPASMRVFLAWHSELRHAVVAARLLLLRVLVSQQQDGMCGLLRWLAHKVVAGIACMQSVVDVQQQATRAAGVWFDPRVPAHTIRGTEHPMSIVMVAVLEHCTDRTED
jgi:hypothetical protein